MNRSKKLALAAIFGTNSFKSSFAQVNAQNIEIGPEQLSYLSYEGFNGSCYACLSGPSKSTFWTTSQDCSREMQEGQTVTYAENMGLCLSEEYEIGFACDTEYKTNLLECENQCDENLLG